MILDQAKWKLNFDMKYLTEKEKILDEYNKKLLLLNADHNARIEFSEKLRDRNLQKTIDEKDKALSALGNDDE